MHDRIDFDVSNLLVRRSWTAELGLRLDTTHEPCCATVESIVYTIPP